MGFVDGAHTIDTNTQLTNAEVAAAATAKDLLLVRTPWTPIHNFQKPILRPWDSLMVHIRLTLIRNLSKTESYTYRNYGLC